jgi:hypothetical protein
MAGIVIDVALETRPLVNFLYRLMLEDLPAGRVAAIMRELEDMPAGVSIRYENEHLRDYAIEIANALERGKPLKMLPPP